MLSVLVGSWPRDAKGCQGMPREQPQLGTKISCNSKMEDRKFAAIPKYIQPKGSKSINTARNAEGLLANVLQPVRHVKAANPTKPNNQHQTAW